MEDDGGGTADPSPPVITVQVKFSGRTIPISINPESTIKDLKSVLQPVTNVLPRGQRLISKGKVLVDTMTLKASELSDGSKLMLMASQGLHQGDGPITKEASSPTNLKRTIDTKRTVSEKIKAPVDKSHSERWKLTGVIALSEYQLTTIPDEVWACGRSIRVLDLSNNSIHEISVKIGSLSSIQKLFLNANDILDKCISWEGITSLKSLSILSLSQNHLTTLPSSLGALTSLTQLHIANNKLTSLPIEIELLTQLEILTASNNRLNSVPLSIGNCRSLIEIDLSSNLLVELPETFGNLHNLKALYLSNNGLKSLPSTLFKMCTQLSALDLHNTEVTMDLLRQFEGWQDFDERRRSKHQKQLDFRVGFSAGFDEGADKK
ncbi:LRR repeats and ubiquitin-like domain-containing protein At2g30105 [Macadamia integrifolia]|uniref:LRR repeats and ubiquitin-like domain-containing protein At2g30105 n=1 Tax=Macadamia integrifolia TaxID=60698 RepID=UPI001C4FE098|nr:LRR repeats and ubiquitin-like domain-containing protein At2g30105 [Macadamia integrifolia]